jgi:hypothetical protein
MSLETEGTSERSTGLPERHKALLVKGPHLASLRLGLLGFAVMGIGFLLPSPGLGNFVMFVGWLIGGIGMVMHWAQIFRT